MTVVTALKINKIESHFLICHSRYIGSATAEVKCELEVAIDKIQGNEVSFVGGNFIHFLAAVEQNTCKQINITLNNYYYVGYHNDCQPRHLY